MPFLGKTPSQIVDPEVDIDGGTIDGVSIGSVNASAGAFTNLTATGTITFPDDGISGDDISGGTATLDGLTVDTNTFVVDSTNNRVGVGTTNPDRQLQVESDTTATFALATTQNSNGGAAEYSFGEFDFLTDDSVGGINTPVAVARIAARAKTDSSVPGGELAFYTNVSGGSQTQTPSERMRIDSSGNVGIGETSPGAKLSIGGGTANNYTDGITLKKSGGNIYGIYPSTNNLEFASVTGGNHIATFDYSGKVIVGGTSVQAGLTPFAQLQVSNSTAGGIIINTETAGANNYARLMFTANSSSHVGLIRYNTSSYAMEFYTNDTERMRFDSSGNLLVGCTALPTAGVKGAAFRPTTDSVRLRISSNDSSATVAEWYTTSGLAGYIATSNTSTSYISLSDERFKENIVDAPAGNIDAIRVRSFDWKTDGTRQSYGLIAQELNEVAPYAVSQEVESDTWGVDPAKLVPMMIKEIQDSKAIIDSQASAIADLTTRLESLEAN